MGFTVGSGKEKMQEKAVQGHFHKVAVGCWFTASGKGIPQLLKYEDGEGCLKMIKDICVLKSEQKYYAGVLSRKYWCRAVFEGREKDFTLLYYPESNSWDMVFS